MKIKRFAQYLLSMALLGSVLSCENPLKDFNLLISTEVIQNSITLEVLNTDGQAVNATVKVSGTDAADIYNLSGIKDFKLVSNLVSFGVDPNRQPTVADPIRFKVEFAAAGYLTEVVDVTIADINNGIMPIRLAKVADVPDGAVTVIKSFTVGADGALPTAATIALDNPEGPSMSINIPAGTQFLDANGKVITGRSVSVSIVSYDPTDPAALALFPGGRLQADGVVLAGGAASSGTFNPAASTSIMMGVDGVAVRAFSKPIAIEMGLSEDFAPSSGSAVSAGTALSIFSNTPSNPVWKHEKEATVQKSGDDFVIGFTVDHLTTFLAGEFIASCAPISQIDFTADWIDQGFTYPVIVEALKDGNIIASRLFSISSENKSIGLDYLPASGVKIVVRRTTDNSIIAESALAACGSVTNIVLQSPYQPEVPKVTLQLYVRCPDKTTTITLLPSFQLFYRNAGTGAYEYLGEVNNGFLSTTLLKSDGTKYDFRAVWKGRSKTVNAKAVQADNSGTIGIQPGDIIGEKSGATNLAILIEECGKL